MSDNPVLINAVNSFKEAAAAAVSETERLAATLKAIPASTQQAQAHLAALTKERDDMVASLEKETTKLKATQGLVAAAQEQANTRQRQGEAMRQQMLAAAQAEADNIVAAAKVKADERLNAAGDVVARLQQDIDKLTAQRNSILNEIEKAAGRLDAMKKTAREFAGA
jgi:chromosome segregation ATPase